MGTEDVPPEEENGVEEEEEGAEEEVFDESLAVDELLEDVDDLNFGHTISEVVSASQEEGDLDGDGGDKVAVVSSDRTITSLPPDFKDADIIRVLSSDGASSSAESQPTITARACYVCLRK